MYIFSGICMNIFLLHEWLKDVYEYYGTYYDISTRKKKKSSVHFRVFWQHDRNQRPSLLESRLKCFVSSELFYFALSNPVHRQAPCRELVFTSSTWENHQTDISIYLRNFEVFLTPENNVTRFMYNTQTKSQ